MYIHPAVSKRTNLLLIVITNLRLNAGTSKSCKNAIKGLKLNFKQFTQGCREEAAKSDPSPMKIQKNEIRHQKHTSFPKLF